MSSKQMIANIPSHLMHYFTSMDSNLDTFNCKSCGSFFKSLHLLAVFTKCSFRHTLFQLAVDNINSKKILVGLWDHQNEFKKKEGGDFILAY